MTNEPSPPIDGNDLRELARNLRRLSEISVQVFGDGARPSELSARVTGHLGCALSDIVPVSERYPHWEHVNVQRGIDAYLEAHGTGDPWFGIGRAMHRMHEDLLSLISGAAGFGDDRPAAPSYGTAPVGPDENTEVVTFGLITATAPDGTPVVIGLRANHEFGPFGPPGCFIEILGPSREAATAARVEIDRLARLHDVYRGQVLSFSDSEHHGNELVTFLPRPVVTAADVVLPDGTLETIERHLVGIAAFSAELLGAGQHLKRGLLLHGPPGTGKTHTVRYLTSRLSGSTVILLTGTSIQFIDQAAALARRLQPSIVVLEDVDLVGMDRDFRHGGNPLLFSLLEAMDGVGADADVSFVLTTNRADVLEVALADRPGRVDLAVEIPRPDSQCRERLIRVYARDLVVDGDLADVIAQTEGVTASFIKEMIRRTVLVSLRAGDRPAVLRSEHFAAVMGEMNAEHQTLTRSLLGAGTDGGESLSSSAQEGPVGSAGPVAFGGFASVRHARRGHFYGRLP